MTLDRSTLPKQNTKPIADENKKLTSITKENTMTEEHDHLICDVEFSFDESERDINVDKAINLNYNE